MNIQKIKFPAIVILFFLFVAFMDIYSSLHIQTSSVKFFVKGKQADFVEAKLYPEIGNKSKFFDGNLRGVIFEIVYSKHPTATNKPEFTQRDFTTVMVRNALIELFLPTILIIFYFASHNLRIWRFSIGKNLCFLGICISVLAMTFFLYESNLASELFFKNTIEFYQPFLLTIDTKDNFGHQVLSTLSLLVFVGLYASTRNLPQTPNSDSQNTTT